MSCLSCKQVNVGAQVEESIICSADRGGPHTDAILFLFFFNTEEEERSGWYPQQRQLGQNINKDTRGRKIYLCKTQTTATRWVTFSVRRFFVSAPASSPVGARAASNGRRHSNVTVKDGRRWWAGKHRLCRLFYSGMRRFLLITSCAIMVLQQVQHTWPNGLVPAVSD